MVQEAFLRMFVETTGHYMFMFLVQMYAVCTMRWYRRRSCGCSWRRRGITCLCFLCRCMRCVRCDGTGGVPADVRGDDGALHVYVSCADVCGVYDAMVQEAFLRMFVETTGHYMFMFL